MGLYWSYMLFLYPPILMHSWYISSKMWEKKHDSLLPVLSKCLKVFPTSLDVPATSPKHKVCSQALRRSYKKEPLDKDRKTKQHSKRMQSCRLRFFHTYKLVTWFKLFSLLVRDCLVCATKKMGNGLGTMCSKAQKSYISLHSQLTNKTAWSC